MAKDNRVAARRSPKAKAILENAREAARDAMELTPFHAGLREDVLIRLRDTDRVELFRDHGLSYVRIVRRPTNG